ncbi:HAMP domain-containing histidine kinase [Salmonella enterica]|nr:HAMP domain-containing histidine kinase [Salmonella enterica]
MKLVGLSRQIALSMMAMALGVTLLVIFTAYVFYYFWEKYWPENVPGISLVPTLPELFWILGTTIAGLALSAWVALNLSRRILAPLNSLAGGIRSLAQGDFNARAIADDHSLGEASQLAADFNHLAEKLQRMTDEQRFWNAAIAHELRTPVTILRGRLQGLAEGVFKPDTTQFESLLLQVEGLNSLIEDLRVVSLAESGHLSLSCSEVDLAEEIESVVELMSTPLQKAGLTVKLHTDIKNAYCDAARIRQALLALLDNAKKHSLPGQVSVSLTKHDDMVCLSVSDEGPGIDPEFIPHVFTPFRRASNAKNHGSGLGLSVVSAIARAHSGQARCELINQSGTQFIVEWPSKSFTN